MGKERCSVCQGSKDYPMLIGHNRTRSICANEFHQESLSMMLELSIWKFIKLWWARRQR